MLIILDGSTMVSGSDDNQMTSGAIFVPVSKFQIGDDRFNTYIERFHHIGCINYNELNALLRPTPVVSMASHNITSGLDDELDIVYSLHRFVHETIVYEKIDEPLDAGEILIRKRGDCSEKSILLASMLEAQGISSYIAEGDAHWYVFAKVEGSWIPLDPTQEFSFAIRNWNKSGISGYYSGSANFPSFLLNSTETLFDRDWCTTG